MTDLIGKHPHIKVPETMRALVVEESLEYGLREVQTPTIEHSTDVLIRVHAVGICGSDIKILHGKNSVATYPRIIGHEVVGEVVAIGKAVLGFSPGTRVVLEPIRSCGKCYACRRGRGNVCRELEIHGITLEGGYADYMVADASRLHILPEGISWTQAVMVEPYSLGEQAFARANVQKDDVVAILGMGPIGLMLLDTVKGNGVETVIVSDMLPGRLKLAKELGATHIIDVSCEDTKTRLSELTQGEGPNVVFDCTGIPAMFNLAMDVASPAGTVVPMAFSAAPIETNTAGIGRKELTIAGSRLAANRFPTVVKKFPRRLSHVDALITHSYPFDQAMEALEKAQSKDPTMGKVVIKMTEED